MASFSNAAAATGFADVVWNMFLGGKYATTQSLSPHTHTHTHTEHLLFASSGIVRPFGSVSLDGIDLDLGLHTCLVCCCLLWLFLLTSLQSRRARRRISATLPTSCTTSTSPPTRRRNTTSLQRRSASTRTPQPAPAPAQTRPSPPAGLTSSGALHTHTHTLSLSLSMAIQSNIAIVGSVQFYNNPPCNIGANPVPSGFVSAYQSYHSWAIASGVCVCVYVCVCVCGVSPLQLMRANVD